jgi:hypothetical protein
MNAPKPLSRKEMHERYMESEHWEKLKCAASAKYGTDCAVCDRPGVQWHHLFYRHPFELGQPEDLMPVCVECHKAIHKCESVAKRVEALPEDADIRRKAILASRDEIMAYARLDVPAEPMPAARKTAPLSDYVIRQLRLMNRVKARRDERRAAFSATLAGLMERNRLKGGGKPTI